MRYEENERTELKRELIADLDKEIVAFLNGKGGIIYVGVEDDGTIKGVPLDKRDDYDLQVSNIMTDGILPNARNCVEYFYNDDGVLEIKVREGLSKPYYLKKHGIKPSGIYIRYGRSRRQATDDEILRMIRESSGWLWEEQESKNQDLHFKVAKIYFDSKGLDFGEHEYVSLGIKTLEGKFTNLGLLVSDENPIEVKFAQYDGKLDFKYKREFTGSIIKIADDVLEASKMFNTLSAKIVGYQAQRIETISFPEPSLREAILNSICHADYDFRSNIKIEFFPEYARISNPGSIYRYTLDQVMKGQQSFRNPGLVRILNKLEFIENYGKGLRRIVGAYEKTGQKPDIESMESSFIVDLPDLNYRKDETANERINETVKSQGNIEETSENSDYSPNANDTVKETAKPMLSSLEERILEAIQANPEISYEGLSVLLRKPRSSIGRAVSSLKEKKFIVREGADKNGHWKILKK